ncbi:MAG: hypothetical protein VW405_04210 [Rhodospirillaceae bacterium]
MAGGRFLSKGKPMRVLGSALALALTVAAAAQAAPQIIGVVATAQPLPVQCADGVCTAEVSGVCLQEKRPAPPEGTAYRAHGTATLTLTVRTPDGWAYARLRPSR